MKKLILCAAIASAGLTTQAFAQSKSFEGFSAGLTVNANNAKADVSGTSPQSVSGTSSTVGVKAIYGWAMGGNFILGADFFYDGGTIKLGTSTSGTDVTGTGLTSLSIDPGVKVSNDTLVYAKLGYATVKGSLSGGGASGSDNYDGTVFGVGVRSMIDKNWSFDVEAAQYNFTAKRSVSAGGDIKPANTAVMFGLNYHF